MFIENWNCEDLYFTGKVVTYVNQYLYLQMVYIFVDIDLYPVRHQLSHEMNGFEPKSKNQYMYHVQSEYNCFHGDLQINLIP